MKNAKPRSSKRRAPKRSTSHVASYETHSDEPRLLSSDEKRELIMAHASARVPQPSSHRFGYYVAVGLSCLFVVSGWWMTLGPSLKRSVPQGPDSLAESVGHEWSTFRQNAATIKPSTTGLQLQPASSSTQTP